MEFCRPDNIAGYIRFWIFIEYVKNRCTEALFIRNERKNGEFTSLPFLLMSKPSPQMWGPVILLIAYGCLVSQNWTVSSQPPLIISWDDFGLKQAQNTLDLWPFMTSGASLHVKPKIKYMITTIGHWSENFEKAGKFILFRSDTRSKNVGVWNYSLLLIPFLWNIDWLHFSIYSTKNSNWNQFWLINICIRDAFIHREK